MKIYADFTFHWFGFYFCLVCCLHEALKSIICKFNNRKGQESAFMEKIYIIEDDENIRNLLKIALEGLALKQRGLKQQKKGWSVSGRNARPWRSSTGCSREWTG